MANPLSDGESFSVTVDGGPVTTVTLEVGGASFTLHTSCSLPINPGLIFGPGNHNIIGSSSDPSLEIFFVQLGSGQVANDNCSGATPTETPTVTLTPTVTPPPTVTPTATPTPSSTPASTPTPVVAGLSSVVEKVLTSVDPAAVGETVTFTIALSVNSDEPLSGVGLLDTFENEFLRYTGSAPAGCTLFANQPDNAHDLVACDVGDVEAGMHSFVFDLSFTAIVPTTPDRTINTVVGVYDQTQVGPAAADVEIVQVLGVQLPPTGDGSLAVGAAGPSTTWWLMIAVIAVLSGAGSIAVATSIRR